MSFDRTTDPVLDALRALVQEKVNEGVPLEPKHKAIAVTVGYPMSIGQLKKTNTPLMAIWRKRSVNDVQGRKVRKRSTIFFDYFLPQTAEHDWGKRWPLLEKVANKTVEAVCGGVWSGGRLTECDVIEVADETWRVDFDFAPNGKFVFPYFRGQMDLVYDPSPLDISDLADATSLHGDINLDGLAENPLVEFTAEI